MKKGETVKGKNLAKTMRERDLIRKANKVHVVVDHKICRPSTIDGNSYRAEKLWTKIGTCKNYSEFKSEVKKIGWDHCKFCCNVLEKHGYTLK